MVDEIILLNLKDVAELESMFAFLLFPYICPAVNSVEHCVKGLLANQQQQALLA